MGKAILIIMLAIFLQSCSTQKTVNKNRQAKPEIKQAKKSQEPSKVTHHEPSISKFDVNFKKHSQKFKKEPLFTMSPYFLVGSTIHSITIKPMGYVVIDEATNTRVVSNDSAKAYSIDLAGGFQIKHKSGFFTSPEMFFSQYVYNEKTKLLTAFSQNYIEFNNEAGVRLKLGYQYDNIFSMYGFLGASVNRFKFVAISEGNSGQNYSKIAQLFGFGANYKINQYSVGLEYTHKKIDNLSYSQGSGNIFNYMLVANNFNINLGYYFS